MGRCVKRSPEPVTNGLWMSMHRCKTVEAHSVDGWESSRLHVDWLQRGQEHAGIIVSDQLAIGETMCRLLNLLNRVAADEMWNQIRWLQAFK